MMSSPTILALSVLSRFFSWPMILSARRLLAGATLLLLSLSACSGRETNRDPGSSREPGSSQDAPAVSQLDPGKVPADLRDLVPLAQRWGIGDDVARSERVQKATEAERSELRAAFGPRQAQITAWLDSFGQGAMSDEAAAFMYTQLATEEMP
jgi:hypothetical protein